MTCKVDQKYFKVHKKFNAIIKTNRLKFANKSFCTTRLLQLSNLNLNQTGQVLF